MGLLIVEITILKTSHVRIDVNFLSINVVCLQQHLSLSPGPIAVNSLVYNHNGQLLLTGAADGRIRLYGLCVISMVCLLSLWLVCFAQVL